MVVSAEKKAEYNKRYYLKHREEQIARVRENQQATNQNRISYARQEYNHQYYLDHRKLVDKVPEEARPEQLRRTAADIKEELKYKNKDYYDTHKYEIKQKRNTPSAKAKRAAYNKAYYQKKKNAKKQQQTTPTAPRNIYDLF